MGGILLGTSGWDYPEWVGPVYPKRGAEDKLRYYAGRFPIVEVNSTFYHLPSVAVTSSWVRRTPTRFRFAAKFPQTITHDKQLVGTDTELRQFLSVLRPIREAKKFAAALLQLPPSLKFEPGTVRSFYESLPRDLPVAVEFREPSWLAPESWALLKEFSLAYVIVDEPYLPIQLDVTAPFAYVRWHGHGTSIWYDYTYSSEELSAWVPRMREVANHVDTIYGFFNNHFRGDAAMNCQSLTEALGLPPPPWRPRLEP